MSATPRILAAAILFALGSSAALAQVQVNAGTPVAGQLTAESPKADDGTPYVLYVYRGRPGERVRIDMDSDDFDAYLAAGSSAAPACEADCKVDDDSGGGLNASLRHVVPASGQLQIRANAIAPDATGAFTLAVSPLPASAAPVTRAARIGTPNGGQFTDATATRDDAGYAPYDMWTLQGRPGQVLVVRMDSDAFDTYLHSGRMERGSFVVEAEDDDSGGGLNARLRVQLDRSGRGLVRATAFGSDARGDYTLSVAEPAQQRPVTVADIAVGESLRGRLDDSDPFVGEDEIRYDVYRIGGSPGQRVVVRMESADFDPVLRWGIYDGERFIEDLSDDDSGGGTSAQFTVTLDADGEGRLHATGYNNTQGNYTLSVVAAPRAAR